MKNERQAQGYAAAREQAIIIALRIYKQADQLK